MKKLIINTEIELKALIKENRANITNINGINFGKLYPILEVTNKHCSFYNVCKQRNEYISAPFEVSFN